MHTNTPDNVFTLERFMAMMQVCGPRPEINVIVTPLARVQFRRPASKRRRIREKWARRPENWRPQSYRAGNTLYIHPDVERNLRTQALFPVCTV